MPHGLGQDCNSLASAVTTFTYFHSRYVFQSGQDETQQYKTLTRTRKFVKDGQVVTEVTSRVVDISQQDHRDAKRREQQLR